MADLKALQHKWKKDTAQNLRNDAGW